MKQAIPPTSGTPATNRRYVPAADVAKACGLTEFALDTRYRPDDWASPRDFYYDGRTNKYAVLSLWGLADALAAAKQTDAATMLRGWLAQLPEPESVELTPAPVAHVEASAAELDRVAGGFVRHHPSDREPRPHWTEGRDE